jgi:hypothetical protein
VVCSHHCLSITIYLNEQNIDASLFCDDCWCSGASGSPKPPELLIVRDWQLLTLQEVSCCTAISDRQLTSDNLFRLRHWDSAPVSTSHRWVDFNADMDRQGMKVAITMLTWIVRDWQLQRGGGGGREINYGARSVAPGSAAQRRLQASARPSPGARRWRRGGQDGSSVPCSPTACPPPKLGLFPYGRPRALHPRWVAGHGRPPERGKGGEAVLQITL